MVRAYESLVDAETKFDVNPGMVAAGRLQVLFDSHAGEPDLLRFMVQVDQILEAVRTTVPQEMWGQILAKLDRANQPTPDLDDETTMPKKLSSPTTRTMLTTSIDRRHLGCTHHTENASCVAADKLRLGGTPTPRWRVARITKRLASTGVGLPPSGRLGTQE